MFVLHVIASPYLFIVIFFSVSLLHYLFVHSLFFLCLLVDPLPFSRRTFPAFFLPRTRSLTIRYKYGVVNLDNNDSLQQQPRLMTNFGKRQISPIDMKFRLCCSTATAVVGTVAK